MVARSLVIISLLIVAAAAAMEVLGWREHTGVVSGMAGDVDLGITYVVTWLAAWIVAPILLGAGILAEVVQRWIPRTT